jgi:RNA-directed DNA polymerase
MPGYRESVSGTLESFRDAWDKVREKNGAPGVDGETTGDFERDLRRNLSRMTEQFERDCYRLSPLRCVPIPKDEGDFRYIGIPTVRDRVVLRAVNTHLVGVWDRYFSEHSFGYRPGRSCRDAARSLLNEIGKGRTWYARGDIRGCFDALDWGYLSAILRRAVTDDGLRRFVNLSFRVPFLYNGSLFARTNGIPTGSPVSPTLANAYLHQFDADMARMGHDVIRYGDDWICLSPDRRSAFECLTAARETLSDMKIEINRSKSGVGDLRRETITFLGYEINAYEICSSSWGIEGF